MMFGRASINGYCEQGGQPVITNGASSTTKVQKSYPQCFVTVYYTGGGNGIVTTSGTTVTLISGKLFGGWSNITISINSVNYTVAFVSSPTTLTLTTSAGSQANVPYQTQSLAPAPVYSSLGSPIANPFQADTNGHWQFFADSGIYDTAFSGAGITPFTWTAIALADPTFIPAPPTYSFLSSGPDWPSQYGNYASFIVNTNNYPNSGLFGAGTTSIPEGFRSALLIPSNTSGVNHGTAIAGYTMTMSPNEGAVGVFGFGGMNAPHGSAWGLNAVVTNCNTPSCDPNSGFTDSVLYGLELDFNIAKLPGGLAPNTALRGIYLIGDSKVNPPNITFAIDVDTFGINQSPHLQWSSAYRTEDGATGVVVEAGANGIGNNFGSQVFRMHSKSSGGVDRYATMQSDPDGNMVLIPGVSSFISLQDGSGNQLMNIGPFNTSLLSPLAFKPVLFANLTTALNTGTYAECSDCKGVQDTVTAGATCVGGGTGALVRRTGSTFQCF